MVEILLKNIPIETGQRVLLMTNGETPNLSELSAVLQEKVTDKGSVLVEDVCSINSVQNSKNGFEINIIGTSIAKHA